MNLDRVLDKNGLLYFWGKVTSALGGKVDKIDGKGLSTNDFTDALKAKVEASISTVPWDDVTDKPDLALKSDLVSVYKFKGSVPTYSALPTENLTVGDVYNVEDSEMNYAWTGTGWDQLGSSQIELEPISNAEIDEIVATS